MNLSPITLEGQFVKLVPLTSEHRDALVSAASDGKLWELWFTSVPNEERVDDYLSMAFEQQSLGRALPFAVIDKHTGTVIGSTRFCNIDVDVLPAGPACPHEALFKLILADGYAAGDLHAVHHRSA